jgi:hypothetical protein
VLSSQPAIATGWASTGIATFLDPIPERDRITISNILSIRKRFQDVFSNPPLSTKSQIFFQLKVKS